jgi:predicted ATPase
MLERLDLEHFKCFELLRLPLGRLTLLSGANASGKSSALQALVLLHQTIREHEWSTRLFLNGEELNLGKVADVVDNVTGSRVFSIGLAEDARYVQWTFEGDRQDMSAAVSAVHVDGGEHLAPEYLRFLLPEGTRPEHHALASRLRRLTYLTAERVGPREIYPLIDPASVALVGPRGEFAVSVLHSGRDELVVDELRVSGHPPTRMRQVEARMREFFPGCSIEIVQVPQANAITLGLKTSNATDFHRPVHVGFGLTQVFPIVVAALTAEPEDLLLIENPEVHLHPAGQALMGRFLAQVAAAGIQVFIESHSDHVLNGIRRAVKASVLAAENVLLHFFRSRDGESEPVVSPTIDETGNIDVWPAGFFDQFDRDMNYFAGWGE